MKVAVTGAFGYSGRYIAERLLAAGHQVITLTNSPQRKNPFGVRVKAYPFNFDRSELLRDSLLGVHTLINTYWVRFDSEHFTHAEAVRNTKSLFQAAKDAEVQRIVHVSITNPDLNSDLPYFRGKAQLEVALKDLGISHCILRPTVLFGKEDVLINNIAWALRHLPAFGVFGAGDYKLQPIFVGDLAMVAAEKATANANEVINAIGPETFTYRELVERIEKGLELRRLILNVSPHLGYWICRALGFVTRDVIITREEIRGLMENRLYVNDRPLGTTRLTDWIESNRPSLGLRYTNELQRRYDRVKAYA